jgi:DNA polymerase-1
VPLEGGLSCAVLDEIDREALAELFAELEFLSLLSKFSLEVGMEEKTAGDEKESKMPEARRVSADEILSYSFESPVVFYEDTAAKRIYLADKNIQLYSDCTLFDIKDIFTKELFFTVIDLKALLHKLSDLGVSSEKVNIDFDIALAAYVLDSTESAYTPERLVTAYLGYTVSEKNLGYSLIELREKMEELLCDGYSKKLYEEIEFPLAYTLFRMEKEGFMVDTAALVGFAAMLDKIAFDCMEKIYELAGCEFNVNSPKQLGEVLFDKMGLPAPKKTKTGYSTSADVLEKLAPVSPIIEYILNYRQVTKLKSTYADGLCKVADAGSRVHTTFTQTVTATGRLSSIEPNLQNIPVRTELGREMRRCFVAKEGYTLVDADYSQIELRLLAAISGDSVMIDAFKKGIDIHTVTASQVFNTPIEEVTPDMRKKAKAVNFGIVYGIGEYSLAGDLHVPMSKAAEYIRSYKEKYASVATYLREIVERAHKDGYVTSLLGRRRMIPDISSPKATIRMFGERVAMNSPIQGTAADIIKIAMLKVEKSLKEENLDAKLILQVHDELIIEASEKDAERAKEILVRDMESALLLEVPLTVSVSSGKTWYECK